MALVREAFQATQYVLACCLVTAFKEGKPPCRCFWLWLWLWGLMVACMAIATADLHCSGGFNMGAVAT